MNTLNPNQTASNTLPSPFQARPRAAALVAAVGLAAALLPATPALAQIVIGPVQGPSLGPVERIAQDTTAGSTEHYSIDENPKGSVSVGTREIPGLGRGLHVVRYNAGHGLKDEALFVPPETWDIVGYSVETMTNGDLLVAGEIKDDYTGFGLDNVFVSRIAADLSAVVWTKLLPGSLNHEPSVTAHQIADGTILVVHNERPDPNGDLSPSYAYVTRLDVNGQMIWSNKYILPGAPLGGIGLSDIGQEPTGPSGNLWAAGWVSTFPISRDPVLLNLDLQFGCPTGEGGWTYPHPVFTTSAFTSIAFDQVPGDPSYTMVAAGPALGNDFNTFNPRPRIVDVPAGGGCPTWDRVYDVLMSPAPTALQVYPPSVPGGATIVKVSGTGQFFGFDDQARLLSMSTNYPLLAFGSTFGNGNPPDTRFNDLGRLGTLIGGREPTPGATDLYYVCDGETKCSEPFAAADLGGGTCAFVFPECIPNQLFADVTLMPIGTASTNKIICRGYRPFDF
ncbi:MAG: hypothetical protein R3B49_02570 [Phycisphaerales bacterium]